MQVVLARMLEVGEVTVGGLIDRLEASGHVERRPDPGRDRRVKRVFITNQRDEMLDRMSKVVAFLDKRVHAGGSVAKTCLGRGSTDPRKKNIKDALRDAPPPGPRLPGSWKV